MLYRIYIIIKRKYSSLRARVFNCEIWVIIYTFFRALGNEMYEEEVFRKGMVNFVCRFSPWKMLKR